MRGTEYLFNVVIIFGSLVFISYETGYWGAGANFPNQTGKHFEAVTLFALGDNAALSRLASVKVLLDRIKVKFQSGWTAVYYHTDAGSMRFSKACKAKYSTKAV